MYQKIPAKGNNSGETFFRKIFPYGMSCSKRGRGEEHLLRS
jgi:hypothetical protein